MTWPYASRARSIIAGDTGQAIILLDLRTGSVQALPGNARTGWHSRHPSTSLVSIRPTALSWGTSEVRASASAQAAPSALWAIRALAAITITLITRSAGTKPRSFARMVRLVRVASFPRHAAELREADAALQAVRWTAQFVPARMACLEESVAAMVALSVAGRRADWRHGVASDPVRMHAWIEVGGQPVGEPAATWAYTPVIHIPSLHPGTGGLVWTSPLHRQ